MIDVALIAAGVRPAQIAVVIDVLRATTTIAQALAGGFERVHCTTSRELALAMAAPGRILAGEEGCVPPPGFDLGNSPVDVAQASGAELVLATSNGTPAIVAAAAACELTLLGCLANLSAVLAAIAGADDVLLVCSGTNGRLAIEDVYVAGRIVAGFRGGRTDAADVAALVASGSPDPAALFRASSNGQLLVDVGLAADIDWCLREDTLKLVPRAMSSSPEVAVVERQI